MQRREKRSWFRWYPADWATFGVLLVIVGTLCVTVVGNRALAGQWLLHLGILVGFVCVCMAMSRWAGRGWVPYCRAALIVAMTGILYVTLGRVAFEAIPWLGDSTLANIDRALFGGTSPSLWIESRISYRSLEFFAFVYATFIPYHHLSVILGCIGRPMAERDIFITGWALTYGVSFLGYLFVPAYGPIVHMASEFVAPLDGGFWQQLIVNAVNAGGGPHGAFPSLHVGASMYVCFFDLRFNRLRGMTYLPLVLLICVSTVVVRYHYVIDLLAGACIALLAIWVAQRWQRRWLSGGEG